MVTSMDDRKLTIPIKGMTCASCVSHVGNALEDVAGVQEVTVNLATEKATIGLVEDDVALDTLIDAVEDAGYGVGTEKVIVSKPDAKQIRTIRNVIVYVKSVPSGLTQATPEASVTIDQKGCRYRPHVLTIQIGQTLAVLNSDATLHNIHGLPKKNAEFNFGQPRAGMKKAMVFKKAEIFRVKCDVHPWMGAYIGVFDHPFHAVSDKVGNYKIDGLPAGDYEIIAWHEVYGEFKQKVTVKAEGDTTLDFELSETKK